ncbi:MAG: bile acid:sodium symporter family protein [Myxococcota bacterium]
MGARIGAWLVRGFAAWVLLGALGGWLWPAGFTWSLDWVEPLLGLVMFGMGMTLRVEDFARVAAQPRAALGGVAAQFVVMPLVAYALAHAAGLPPALAAGVVLVGSCPGGTASNVVTFLARGDLALSVTMTSVATLLAPLVTPLLVWGLAGRWVPVDFAALLLSILQIVLAPVLLGLLLHHRAPRLVARALPATPIVSVLTIVLIVAGIVGATAPRLADAGPPLLAVVAAHNGLGLALGYAAAAALGLALAQRRTIALEVGMQNSGLAVALAVAHFDPMAALAGAAFSVWHNLTGPALATWWARSPHDPSRRPTAA